MSDRHTKLKHDSGNRKLWSKGYCVSAVGLNEATIAKYTWGQESVSAVDSDSGHMGAVAREPACTPAGHYLS